MIKEDFISLETAKLLKKKGFDCECSCYYFFKDKEQFEESLTHWNWNDGYTFRYSAPTLQMAMKWLREVHKLYCDIRVGDGDFVIDIISLKDGEFGCEVAEPESCVYPTYEEAAEAAIKYVLENLI